jgi:hypothetical protein
VGLLTKIFYLEEELYLNISDIFVNLDYLLISIGLNALGGCWDVWIDARDDKCSQVLINGKGTQSLLGLSRVKLSIEEVFGDIYQLETRGGHVLIQLLEIHIGELLTHTTSWDDRSVQG